MTYHPPKDATVNLWLLYSSGNALILEGLFTHKVQAEAAMRWHKENYPGIRYYIAERITHPHGESYK